MARDEQGEKRKLLKTAEVVKRAGITRQTLYTYTTMGLIEEQDKTATGHKLYGESVFRRLKLIHDLQESGYTLRDIQDLFGSRLRTG
jgi:DNA-binding transcriptional MerR regulator